MTVDLNFRVAELERRFENLARIATVIEVDLPEARLKVKDGEFVSSWLPWLTPRSSELESHWDAPELGERVGLICPSGDLSSGFVLPSLFCDQFPPQADRDSLTQRVKGGSRVQSYDREAKTETLSLPADGTFTVKISNQAEITMTKDSAIVTVGNSELKIMPAEIIVKSALVNLGDTGGQGVARIGDAVDPQTFKIVEGSNVTKST